MATTFDLRRVDVFPVGTSISAYRILGLMPSSGPPPGTAVSTVTMASNGVATFTGLTDGATYVAYAGSPVRYSRCMTDPAPASSGGGGSGISPTIIDAKGDLLTGTSNDAPARLAPGSDTQMLIADSSQTTGLRWAAQPLPEIAPTFSYPGNLVAGSGTAKFRMPFHGTVLGVAATLGTAPTGSSVILDVNKNGVSLFTTQANRPTFTAGALVSTATLPDRTSLTAGDLLSVDVDQAGGTIAGADLTVTIYLQKALTAPASYPSVVAVDTPLAYWRLEEPSGTTAADSSGNSHPGTYTGTVTLGATGPIPSSLALSAAGSGYMKAALNLSAQNKLTVEFFLSWPTFSASNQRALEFSNGTTSAGATAGGFYVVPNGSGGTFDVGMYNGTGYSGSTFARPSAGVFHHYLIELDRTVVSESGAVKMWIDGIAQTATPFTGSVAQGGNFINGFVTALADNAGANAGTGTIDEVAIFAGLLSTGRIAAHINAV
jgi:hypothetical protein